MTEQEMEVKFIESVKMRIDSIEDTIKRYNEDGIKSFKPIDYILIMDIGSYCQGIFGDIDPMVKLINMAFVAKVDVGLIDRLKVIWDELNKIKEKLKEEVTEVGKFTPKADLYGVSFNLKMDN